MKSSRCLMTLAAVLLLAGCTPAKNTKPRLVPPGAEFRTGLPLEPGFANQFGYSLRWTRSIDLSGGQSILSAAPLGEHLVTVEEPGNIVTATHLADGSLAWKRILGEPLEVLVGAVGDEDHVYVNSTQRLFKLARHSGRTVEIFDLPRPVNMTPLLVKNLAVFGSIDGRFYAFDVNTGFPRWTYGLKSRVLATPVLKDDTVFVADNQGHYAMLDVRSGELRWRGSTYGDLNTTPLVHRSNIVLASDDQSLYSFAANTGRDAWLPYRSEKPLAHTPVIVDDVIYLVEPGLGLTAIDSRSGEPVWKIQDNLRPVTGLNGQLIVQSDEALVRIDPADGQITQTVPTRKLQAVINGPDHSLLLLTPRGEIMRLDPHR